MNLTNKRGGFIGKIILLIIAVIALKYLLHFDLVEWFKSDQAQAIIQPAYSFFKIFYGWLDNIVKTFITSKTPTLQ